jgi:hypothetical protein
MCYSGPGLRCPSPHLICKESVVSNSLTNNMVSDIQKIPTR